MTHQKDRDDANEIRGALYGLKVITLILTAVAAYVGIYCLMVWTGAF